MKTKKNCRDGIPNVTNSFADIHCHPHMRSFNWLHEPGIPESKGKYHPWWIILPKFKSSKKGNRAAAYSQCDMVRVKNGNLKLAIVSLYPMEKGWVKGPANMVKGRLFDFKKIFGNNLFNDIFSGGVDLAVKPLLFLLGRSKKEDPALRDLLQSVFMKLPFKKINFYQSDEYDYFRELKEEREYLLKKNKVETRSEIYIPPKKWYIKKSKIRKKCPAELDATGTYVLAENGDHVKEIINDGKIAFVLSIEGANALNTHLPPEKVIKNIEEVKKWKEPLFFITFTHHFYNYLAGHAHSIPDIGKALIDQQEGMTGGFNNAGWKIIRYLLSLDTNNNYKPEEFNRRILIDVKHMNVISRMEFYNEIVNPCFRKGDIIPLIASHVAFSGREKLTDLVANMNQEVDGFSADRFGHTFNAWNINLCDEDVITIFKTGGLIGINLDQRILGIPKKDKKNKEIHIQYIWQNMKAMMKAVIESDETGLPPKKEVVNLLCLGTDFDGYIDPADKYSTTLEFQDLRDDLVKTINKDPKKDDFLFNTYTTEDLVEKICFSNAYDFVVKNFK